MDVYNSDKTEILTEYDIEKGKLTQDTLRIHHEATDEVLEQGHYETVAEYPNGGKDVKYIIDVPHVAACDDYDEIIDILVYTEYTEDELKEIENQRTLVKLKEQLAATDYEAIKYAEGWFTEEEYADIKEQREALRIQIRAIIDNDVETSKETDFASFES